MAAKITLREILTRLQPAGEHNVVEFGEMCNATRLEHLSYTIDHHTPEMEEWERRVKHHWIAPYYNGEDGWEGLAAATLDGVPVAVMVHSYEHVEIEFVSRAAYLQMRDLIIALAIPKVPKGDMKFVDLDEEMEPFIRCASACSVILSDFGGTYKGERVRKLTEPYANRTEVGVDYYTTVLLETQDGTKLRARAEEIEIDFWLTETPTIAPL
jgi:hypothetical protein